MGSHYLSPTISDLFGIIFEINEKSIIEINEKDCFDGYRLEWHLLKCKGVLICTPLIINEF